MGVVLERLHVCARYVRVCVSDCGCVHRHARETMHVCMHVVRMWVRMRLRLRVRARVRADVGLRACARTHFVVVVVVVDIFYLQHNIS